VDAVEALSDRPEVSVLQVRPEDHVLGGYYVLVERFPDGQIHVAFRAEPWDVWSLGAWGVQGSRAS